MANRLADYWCDVFHEEHGVKYPFRGRDAAVLKQVLADCGDKRSLAWEIREFHRKVWKSAWEEIERAQRAGAESVVDRLGTTVTAIEIAGVPVLDIKPRGWRDNGKVLIYTHGGAYALASRFRVLIARKASAAPLLKSTPRSPWPTLAHAPASHSAAVPGRPPDRRAATGAA